MRHSQEEKLRNHERIVDVAAQRIRESGTEAPGVAEIMQSAGLTHGGFYKHFVSRDELIAEAAERAFAQGAANLAEATDGADDPLTALLDAYLSAEHRDDPGTGCGLAALGGDATRPGNPVRPAFTAQVRRYIDRLQTLAPATGSAGADRLQAIGAVSALIGGLTLARAVDDPDLADEILDAVRASMSTPPAPNRRIRGHVSD